MRKYFVFGVIFSSAVILEPFGASRAALAGEGPGSCDADIDNSGTIDGADLSIVLSAWGPCAAGAKCPSDLTGDGLVDGADLATLLANWGACEPRLGCDIETTWSTEFLIHGLSNTVWSTTIFDDGSGPALYAGGQFLFAAGGTQVNGVARWSGLHWTPLGDGVANGSVLAMAAHDDGSGPSLYVGGSFSHAGGIPTGGIARWDGQQWHPVGSGIAPGTVRAMTSTVIDGVPTLCVAVNTTSGGITSGSVAVWRGDRSGWTTIGSAMNGEIRALAVYGDSDSTYLYAGGSFTGTEQQSLLGIARVQLPLAEDWEPVAGGLNEGGSVYALHVHEEGTESYLFVGGNFSTAGGISVSDLARWDGSQWTSVGSGVTSSGFVQALASFDAGDGMWLYIGGHFSSVGGGACDDIAKWNGSTWSCVDQGLDNAVGEQVMTLSVNGAGPNGSLFIGGSFLQGNGRTFGRIAEYKDLRLRPLGHNGPHGSVYVSDSQLQAVTTFDDGDGEQLYVGGWFTIAGTVPASNIARWNGQRWYDIGGITGPYSAVNSLAVFDSGDGPALYVGGGFSAAGGVPASSIARWDGVNWSSVGTGVQSGRYVRAMVVHDDGSGPALFVGGDFITAGGQPAGRIAKWDGSQWSTLGSGLAGGDGVRAMVVMDDGSGPALYVGGQFSHAGGAVARNIAKWNGVSWEPLGSGLGQLPGDAVWSLAAFDDGNGMSLWAGGTFNGPIFNATLARWDGAAWVGTPFSYPSTGTVTALEAFQGPGGPRLCVASYAGGVRVFDGSDWALLGLIGGVEPAVVLDMHSTQSDSDAQVYLVGTFETSDSQTFRGYWENLASLRADTCDDGDPCTVDTCEGGVCVHTLIDADGDGYAPVSCGGSDCDDGDPDVNPGMTEVCGNGLDDDCNGLIDCDDQYCKGDASCDALDWATVLEFEPDPTVVTDSEWRVRIIATGLPWRIRANASGIEMLLIPPGTFDMGCSPSNQYGCGSDENPVHEVTLTQPFYLGRYEVTQAQWTSVMGSNPSWFQSPSSYVPAEQVPFRPVEQVSWNMIQGFEAATGLRLPTEAEWEYACRAGTQTAFNLPPNGTNDDSLAGQLGWFSSNSASQTRPVGQKQANNLGLHDMHGNVMEWCEDWWGSGYYAQSPSVDPPGPISGAYRVLRGGNWIGSSNFGRASMRTSGPPGGGNVGFNLVGFRAARTP